MMLLQPISICYFRACLQAMRPLNTIALMMHHDLFLFWETGSNLGGIDRANRVLPRQVWELSTCKLQTDHIGHTGYINTVTISPDGSLCASGGKDGTTMLWDLNESKHLYSLNAGDEIHALTFSPNRYWLCAATASSIIIFDLEKKSKVDELKPEFTAVGKKSREPECVSLAWSADGQTLFAGYTDNIIRAWGVMSRA